MSSLRRVTLPDGTWLELQLDGSWLPSSAEAASLARIAGVLSQPPWYEYRPWHGSYGPLLAGQVAARLGGTSQVIQQPLPAEQPPQGGMVFSWFKGEWEEEKHPRDQGKFAPSSGGGKEETKPAGKEEKPGEGKPGEGEQEGKPIQNHPDNQPRSLDHSGDAARITEAKPEQPAGHVNHEAAVKTARTRLQHFTEALDRITNVPVLAQIKQAGAWCKEKTQQLYKGLENRYGRPAALTIMASGQAVGWGTTAVGAMLGVPLVIPGVSIIGALPAVAVAEVYLQLTGGPRRRKRACSTRESSTSRAPWTPKPSGLRPRSSPPTWRRHSWKSTSSITRTHSGKSCTRPSSRLPDWCIETPYPAGAGFLGRPGPRRTGGWQSGRAKLAGDTRSALAKSKTVRQLTLPSLRSSIPASEE